MSNNVVTLPRKDPTDAVWVCNCGRTTHYHRADGEVECGACSVIATGASGEWRQRLPELEHTPPPMDVGMFKVIDLQDAETFFRRKIKDADTAAAILVIHDDGCASTWSGKLPEDDPIQWLREKVGLALDRWLKPGEAL